MPRQGQKGLSLEDKAERGKEIDEKIKKMLEELMARPEGQQGPDKALLKKHLSQTEISALWKRLEGARGGAPPNVAAAWEELKSLNPKVAKQERCNTLFTFLQNKDWQQVLLQVKDTVSKTVVQKVAKHREHAEQTF